MHKFAHWTEKSGTFCALQPYSIHPKKNSYSPYFVVDWHSFDYHFIEWLDYIIYLLISCIQIDSFIVNQSRYHYLLGIETSSQI